MRKILYTIFAAALAAVSFLNPATPQTTGMVPLYAVPYGLGPGVIGFGAVSASTSGFVLTTQGVSNPPVWQSLTSIVTGFSAPKTYPYLSGQGVHMPSTGTTLMRVWIVGPGGGGAGNSAANSISTYQRGTQGLPSAFETQLTSPITITTGATTRINWAGHPFTNNNQAIYLTTTGTFPTGISTVSATESITYYVNQASIVPGVSFELATRPSNQFPGDVQPPVVTSGAGSGTFTGTSYRYIATAGGPGGTVGDQGSGSTYLGCDPTQGGPNSKGFSGGSGSTGGIVANDSGGAGASGFFGGGAGSSIEEGGNLGVPYSGSGGAGAGGTRTSFGGTGGGAGGACEIWVRPNFVSGHRYIVGANGAGGVKATIPVTFTIGTSTVNAPLHGFGTNAALQFTCITGPCTFPTNINTTDTYYVDSLTVTANTFKVTPSGSFPGAQTVVMGGTQAGTIGVTSGYVGGDPGIGTVIVTEFFGLQ